MIEDEIREALNTAGRDSEELNLLVDQFRSNRSARSILRLLDSDHHELIEIGAWILSEIPFSCYDENMFKSRLLDLTSHPTPIIRLHSLIAVFPFLDSSKKETKELISKMLSDENEGVRLTAESTASQLGL